MAFDDDEHVLGVITLLDQLRAGGEMLEAGSWADFRLLEVRQRVGQQRGVADQVVQELLLALLVAVDMAEHFAARIGNQAQRFFADVTARWQLDTLAQADQVAFLQVEQRALIHQRMDQAILDEEQMLAGQLAFQVVGSLQADGFASGFQAGEQLRRNALQAIDQSIGVGRLFTE